MPMDPATSVLAIVGPSAVTDSASESECASMLALFDGLDLKEKYYNDILKYKLTEEQFQHLVQNHGRIGHAAPFLKENLDDLYDVAGALENFKKTGKFVQNRAEWLRRLPYEIFLGFLASCDPNMVDRYAESVITAKIDKHKSYSIFNAKLRTVEEEKSHLLTVAPFLNEEDANYLATKILKQKMQNAGLECSAILGLLNRLGLREKYFDQILVKPFTNDLFHRVCDQEPNSEDTNLDIFKEGGDFDAIFKAFDEIRRNSQAGFQDERSLLKHACFLNILDHLGLRQKYEDAVVENDVRNETVKEWIFQSIEKPMLPKFITVYRDKSTLLKLLRLLKKSEGTNLLPHISPEELKFTEKDLLGKGSFGHVTRCFVAMFHVAAMKTFLPGSVGKGCIELAQAELTTISKLSHPNIVNVWGYVQVEETDVPRLLLEYLENGNLTQHLRKCYDHWHKNLAVTEVMVRHLVRVSTDIVRGMEYLHSQNCLHRDLKPDNIFMNNNNSAKVGDFGISKFLNPNPNGSMDGDGWLENEIEQNHYYSFYFSAKEALPPKGRASKGTDVWSFGVVLQQVWSLAAQKPYGNEKMVEEVKKCIREGRNPYDCNPNLILDCTPSAIKSLFAKIFNPQNSEHARPSFTEILTHLSTEFGPSLLPEETFDIKRGIDFDKKFAQLQKEDNPQFQRVLKLVHETFEMRRKELRELKDVS